LPRNVYLVDLILEKGEDEKKCFDTFFEHCQALAYNCGCTLIDSYGRRDNLMLKALTKVYKKKINYIDVSRTTDTFKDIKFHALIDEDNAIFGLLSKDSEINITN